MLFLNVVPSGKFVLTTNSIETEARRTELIDQVPAQQGSCRDPMQHCPGRDYLFHMWMSESVEKAGQSRRSVRTGRTVTKPKAYL